VVFKSGVVDVIAKKERGQRNLCVPQFFLQYSGLSSMFTAEVRSNWLSYVQKDVSLSLFWVVAGFLKGQAHSDR
jgi:hypothetical protein